MTTFSNAEYTIYSKEDSLTFDTNIIQDNSIFEDPPMER